MTYLCIAPNYKWFKEEVLKLLSSQAPFESNIIIYKSSGTICCNGDKYVYASSLEKMRGYHAVKVLQLGTFNIGFNHTGIDFEVLKKICEYGLED